MQDQKGTTEWTVEKEHEFRFELGAEQSLTLEVTLTSFAI